MQQVRNQRIDIAKGITIILMVLGHSSLPNPLSHFIWAFHMPLFFIASGWMTKWGKYSMKDFCIRKSKSLMLPFICYSAILLVWRGLLLGGGIYDWLTIGWGGYAMWFIPVLYFALLLGKVISLIPNDWLQYCIIILLVIVGCILCHYEISLPWTLSTVPYATFLVYVGNKLRKYQNYIDTPRRWWLSVSMLITWCVSYFWRLDLCSNNILPILPLTIGAFAGTFMVYTLSSYIAKYKKNLSIVLQSVGRETYIVVAFSQIIIMTINQYITHSAPIKYALLVMLLVAIKYVKDGITKVVNT